MENKFRVTALAASSSGNSYHIKHNNTEILVDVGISAKCVCDRLRELGTDITNIDAIFITHEHIDHVKGLAVLSNKYDIPIHMTSRSAEEFLRKNPKAMNITQHELRFECRVGNILARSFFSSHDSCECVGYTFEADGYKFGLATDLGYVDREAIEALVGCNSVVLESNYDEKKLICGSYPEHLKDRIRSNTGHLSNYDCAAFARYLAENGTRFFMLGHLSEENNTPEIAYNSTSRALADFDDGVIKVASKHSLTYCI